jgi:hypothetical protein
MLLEKINSGILHPYGVIATILGALSGYLLFTKQQK